MNVYMAPMEGVTNYVFRKVYIKHFTGADKFFTPFITPHMKKGFSKSELMELNPEYNKGQCLVPQILTNNVSDFLKLVGQIKEMGYDEFNINLGCPSGTVTSKKRGAGFLLDTKGLDEFFYNIFEKISDIKLSIKTRIGFSDYSEWEELVKIYSKYDFCEIIIHPRLRSDFYKNQVYMPAFSYALEKLRGKIIYNGDINTLSDYKRLNEMQNSDKGDKFTGVMIGRGLVKNPLLPLSIKSGNDIYDMTRIKDFMRDVRDEYMSLDFGERNTLFKLKEIWGLVLENRDNYFKSLKRIRKADNISEYNLIVNSL